MMPPLSTLQDGLTVTLLKDGRVAVTVSLPPELVRDYCFFLQGLAGFFHAASRKSVASLAHDRTSIRIANEEATARVAAYRQRLVNLFDDYTARGLPRKEAVKRVAADLRAESHPWCAFDLVRSELVAAGRGGRAGRPRRVNP